MKLHHALCNVKDHLQCAVIISPISVLYLCVPPKIDPKHSKHSCTHKWYSGKSLGVFHCHAWAWTDILWHADEFVEWVVMIRLNVKKTWKNPLQTHQNRAATPDSIDWFPPWPSRSQSRVRTVKACALSGEFRSDHKSSDSPRSITMHGGKGWPEGSTMSPFRLSTTFLTYMSKTSVTEILCCLQLLNNAKHQQGTYNPNKHTQLSVKADPNNQYSLPIQCEIQG